MLTMIKFKIRAIPLVLRKNIFAFNDAYLFKKKNNLHISNLRRALFYSVFLNFAKRLKDI